MTCLVTRPSLVKWRQRLGDEGCEWLLTETINAGLKLKVIKPSRLKRVVVGTTVQEKNITFPTDAKLYHKARQQLVDVAHELKLTLRQTYDKALRRPDAEDRPLQSSQAVQTHEEGDQEGEGLS